MKIYKITKFSLLFILISTAVTFADDKIEKTYRIDDFRRIYLKGPYEVHLRQYR